MMLLGSITERADMKCPKCGIEIITPVAFNPFKQIEEKMILVAGNAYVCGCGAVFTVSREQALAHNSHWFPEDPEFKEKGP